MTLVDVSTSTGENLRTTMCSLCGDVEGEDYTRFSYHLFNEHTFDDLNLSSGGGPPTIGRSPGGVSA